MSKENTNDRGTHGAKEAFALSNHANINYEGLKTIFPDRTFQGIPGKTGILIYNKKGEITGAIRGPQWIQKSSERKEDYRKVVFGGNQTERHIEQSFLNEFGKETAANAGKLLIQAAKRSVHLPFYASVRGSEVESYLIDKKTGEIIQAPLEQQEELISGMVETALPPAATIEEGLLFRAKYVISKQHPDTFLLNTSVPLIGDPSNSGLGINNGKYEEYVAGVSAHLRPQIGRFDEYGGQVADFVARKMGYENLEEMQAKEPTMKYWSNAAGHHSVSLPHFEIREGQFIIPTEFAIAAADIVASDMGKIAELLMYSSPLILGEAPRIKTPEGEKWPLDYRDLYRHLMKTTFPGDLIRTPETLKDRMTKGIIDGEVHTLDRTAFRTEFTDGTSFPSFHGPVRLRSAIPEGGKPIGRIESTGPGSSFSLLDEAARDIFLDVLSLAAYEAVAHGQHPADYFGDKYPSLMGSSKRMDIGRGYNLNGPSDPTAGEVIKQTLDFMEDMADKYPPYKENIQFAQNRIANLTQTATAQNFEEYSQNPVGPISQVMQNMYQVGYSPLEIALAAADYELNVAKALVATNGDPKTLLTNVSVRKLSGI